MDFAFFITLFIIGFIGSFLSGMVGIGGSVINYPMLLYIPPLVGVMALSAHEVSGIGAIQVLFSTLGGVLAYRKADFTSTINFIYGEQYIGREFIRQLFITFPSRERHQFSLWSACHCRCYFNACSEKGQQAEADGEVTFHKGLAAGIAFVIGSVSGVLVQAVPLF